MLYDLNRWLQNRFETTFTDLEQSMHPAFTALASIERRQLENMKGWRL